ncbi:Hypothetical predicted protein [Paramuricea clavata]|uniref:Uncharacterized protein n=1 Tax=Paramuricea clavata TaxID=317549 RepID=A0A7D9HL25_PARCT|nr:Hypothetical predicted protein [Paramuricea clavata]
MRTWLNQPLPSTHLPPHIWATVDKAMLSCTTIQATFVIARNEDGIPFPIPTDAPKQMHQATNIRGKVLEMLGIGEDDAHLALPVTWDAVHALNLGVTDVKDSKEASGIHFLKIYQMMQCF